VSHQSLGAVVHLLEKSDTLGRALGSALPSGIAGWLRGPAVSELAGVTELRNPAAHSEAVTRERVEQVRARVCGVGCEGLLVRMAKGKKPI
ncbi:MAG: hypothetical protein R6U98_17760, partial [Pirellulaceae bacterium]